MEQGAPIIRLRDAEQRAGLEQAQAALKEAQACFSILLVNFIQVKEADHGR